MLEIYIPATEQWDERTEKFIHTKAQTLQLEHSLVSISKWESRWHKAFLSDKSKSQEETLDYIKCMTITQNISDDVYQCLTNDDVNKINQYISNPMTATCFSEEKSNKRSREVVTSELIYYWMTSYNIPFKCENWHLNRLLTLIRVCNVKNTPPKKRSKRELMSRNAAMNAARRKQLNSKG